MHRTVFLVCGLLLLVNLTELSAKNKAKYYISPLKEDYNLTGTFAEIRPNHFHSGIDFGTRGVIKLPVQAVAEGWVSRIKIEAGGYGRAIYIDHPNGTTSVYGHLWGFRDTSLLRYIKEQQYQKRTFAIDLFPEKEQFRVKKGDTIAYSGNAGTSTAPHLHFEIRDRNAQAPFNIMQLIPGINDEYNPIIKNLFVYNEDSLYFGISRKKEFRATSIGYNAFKIRDTIDVNTTISLGLEVSDQISEKGTNGGIYIIKVKKDTSEIYAQQFDEFTYANVRYVNAYIDYDEFLKSAKEIHRQLILPNNALNIYHCTNNGLITLTDTNVHKFEYTVQDFFGNHSKLVFYIRFNKRVNITPLNLTIDSKFMKWDNDNVLKNNLFTMNIPSGTLFNNMLFEWDTVKTKIAGLYSPVILLKPEYTGFFRPFQFAIKPNVALPDTLYNKLLVAYIDTGKKKLVSVGGQYENGFVKAQLRNFGTYALTIDTVPPAIRPLFNIDKLRNAEAIVFRVSDELSGIGSFEGTIDGNWVLFEHDFKSGHIYHTFDNGHYKKGIEHICEFIVTDNKGNTSKFMFKFFR